MAVQILRPIADITNATWGTTPWSQLNDQSDSTVSTSANTFPDSNQTLEVKVAAGSDPLRSDGYSCTVRMARSNASPAQTVTISFVDGTNVIASQVQNAATSLTDYTLALSGVEADAVTNHADLRVRIVATNFIGSQFVLVSEVWITLPEPAFAHLDLVGGMLVNAGAASGNYLTMAPTGGLLRVAGVETAGALYRNAAGEWLVKT